MAQKDPFLDKVAGKIPESTHISSAKTWAPKDGDYPGVPRPDIPRGTLVLWSAIGGLLGLDHFYMRSPWTGIAKMFTAGGFGVWWLWDWLQLVFESDRVSKYGMSTPFDFVTGIGQGMIYDGPATAYKTNASFGFWILFKIVFGLFGVSDIFIENHVWYGALKMFFSVVVLSLFITVFFVGPSWFQILVFVLSGIYFAANCVAWFSDLSIIITDPVGFMKKGLPTPEYTYKTFKGLMDWYKTKDGAVVAGYEQTVQDSQITPTNPMGIIPPKEGTTPKQLTKMFSSRHTTETAEEIRPQTGGGEIKEVDPSINSRNSANKGINNSKNASIKQINATNLKKESATLVQESTSVDLQEGIEKPGTSIPPLALAGRVAQVGWDNFTGTMSKAMKAIAFAINPPGAVAAEIQLKKMEMLEGKGGAAGALGGLGALAGGEGALGGAAQDALGASVSGALGGAAQGVLGASASGALGGAAQDALGKAATGAFSLPNSQKGGYRRSQYKEEPLTTEAQIMGATVIALIAGGSLKGLVDYLMPQ